MPKKEAIIYPLFSSPLMGVSLDIDSKKILDFIKKVPYRKLEFGYESQVSISNKLLENKNLKKEKNIFLTALNVYFKVLSYSGKFKILNSWATKTLKNCGIPAHTHANSWLSAVYYPEYNEKFTIGFLQNYSYIGVDYDDPYNIYSCSEWKMTPPKNTLLIFPSSLNHKLNKNTSNKTRYSIAFNVNPMGLFSKGSDIEGKYE